MKKVYESWIEISIEPKQGGHPIKPDKLHRHLRIKQRQFKSRSFESSVLGMLINYTYTQKWFNGQGNVLSHGNCLFSVLFEVFGIDLIAYLFDKQWVPQATVDHFQPREFLNRLLVLEVAAKDLSEGDKLPLPPQGDAERYSLGTEGPNVSYFNPSKQAFFLKQGLHRLREFGHFARLLTDAGEQFSVSIRIMSPDDIGDDIMAYAVHADDKP